MPTPRPLPPARGASENTPNRFEALHFETDLDAEAAAYLDPETNEPLTPKLATQFLRDHSQSVISKNASPDLGFDLSLNPYRGCEHGCAYCYARPYHEYLGFSPGLDFESKIMVKPDAPDLLHAELSKPSYKPKTIALSGVTDPYQPVERRLGITRRCLEVLADFRQPVAAITKNHLVTRDIDHYKTLAEHQAAAVALSVTSLDPELARTLEPRASSPKSRLRAIRELTQAGIPAGVSLAPVIPGLNDHEIPKVLEAAADHGAKFATYVVLRLPYAVKDIFAAWLDNHLPLHKDKILSRVADMRGSTGRLNDSDFHTRFKGTGIVADTIATTFKAASHKHGFTRKRIDLSTASFRRPTKNQPELF